MLRRALSISMLAGMALLGMLVVPALPVLAGETVEVAIDKMLFLPQRLQIRTGTTVIWINKEKRTYHTVYFEKEGLTESDPMFPGEKWQRVFNKPGTYPYRCGPHEHMTGVIEVTE